MKNWKSLLLLATALVFFTASCNGTLPTTKMDPTSPQESDSEQGQANAALAMACAILGSEQTTFTNTAEFPGSTGFNGSGAVSGTHFYSYFNGAAESHIKNLVGTNRSIIHMNVTLAPQGFTFFGSLGIWRSNAWSVLFNFTNQYNLVSEIASARIIDGPSQFLFVVKGITINIRGAAGGTRQFQSTNDYRRIEVYMNPMGDNIRRIFGMNVPYPDKTSSQNARPGLGSVSPKAGGPGWFRVR